MFYKSTELPKGLFKSCIIPRPIAWISTIAANGQLNLAPFSYFNAVCDAPPMIMIATTNAHISGGPKDTLKNIEETGEFVINIATYALRHAMNLTSAALPREINEFEYAQLEYEASEIVQVPRVKASPIHLECRYHSSLQLPSYSLENINRMVIGEVVGIHVDPQVIADEKIDLTKLQPIARLGYNDYLKIDSGIFSLPRPL